MASGYAPPRLNRFIGIQTLCQRHFVLRLSLIHFLLYAQALSRVPLWKTSQSPLCSIPNPSSHRRNLTAGTVRIRVSTPVDKWASLPHALSDTASACFWIHEPNATAQELQLVSTRIS